jgi:hypothetical protein
MKTNKAPHLLSIYIEILKIHSTKYITIPSLSSTYISYRTIFDGQFLIVCQHIE